MYLEIGNDLLIESRAVLGVFDLDNTSWSKRTRAFLEAAQENGELIDLGRYGRRTITGPRQAF